ncbi:unnamed protein product [Mytilus coruscus]|uniref:B box-type domain-containing protein n=1 Tax=Mytilus coruscus TaxID=42192 RepID=A0A6J8D8K2_MYTCO|nr:unnamed protein product [Mytilus coruscus]
MGNENDVIVYVVMVNGVLLCGEMDFIYTNEIQNQHKGIHQVIWLLQVIHFVEFVKPVISQRQPTSGVLSVMKDCAWNVMIIIVSQNHQSTIMPFRLKVTISYQPNITNIVNYCHEHDMKYTNYCPHHEKLCCPACIYVDHKNCTDILLLQHVLKTAKTSALLDSIELSIKDIQSNIKDIIEDRRRNIITINDQRQIYHHEIKQIRNKVNSYLDTLEQKMRKDIDAAENKANTEIERLIAKLSEKTHVADNFVQNISAIKMYASDLQAFIGSKSIEAEVEAEEKYLHSLTKDGSLDQIRLKLNIDTKLSNIESTIESFGTVTLETKPPLVVLKRGKDKQAQIMSVVPRVVPKSFDEMTLSQISQFTLKVKNRQKPYEIRGITVLPDGKIILADSGRLKLFIVNNNGMLDKSISCQLTGTGPFDVTYIKDNEVAISTSSGIQIINIHSGTVLENIKLTENVEE